MSVIIPVYIEFYFYRQELDNDLDKPERQIWVSLHLESEKDYSVLNDPEIRDVFDLWICYRQDEEQKGHPLCAYADKLKRSCRNKRVKIHK